MRFAWIMAMLIAAPAMAQTESYESKGYPEGRSSTLDKNFGMPSYGRAELPQFNPNTIMKQRRDDDDDDNFLAPPPERSELDRPLTRNRDPGGMDTPAFTTGDGSTMDDAPRRRTRRPRGDDE